MKVFTTILCWLAALLAAGIATPNARAECETNQPTTIDLGNWTRLQYGPFNQPPAVWELSASNTVALQTVNADASILLSPFSLQNDQIQGSWMVNTNDDDDFIGFVFGYQDTTHFYLFDWKQLDQANQPNWGNAEQGMSVKVISANTTLTARDFASTLPADTNRVRSLYHNRITWDDYAEYVFYLEFRPGHFNITVTSSNNTILAAISLDDNTYTNGQFGFYNFSQSQVRYVGFTRRVLRPRPVVSVASQSVVEGDSGTTDLAFSVTLSETNCEQTRVSYAITPGTATEGVDYTSAGSGTLVFEPGETNKLVHVSVFGDTINEEDETLFITLSNPVSATLGTSHAVGTILDDDPYPTLLFDDVSVLEGDSGMTFAVFTFTLSAPSEQLIEVCYETFDGTAEAFSDYEELIWYLSFPPGETSLSVEVTIYGDTTLEPDESFTLCLSDPYNVTLSRDCAVGTILNDDMNQPPTVSIINPADGASFLTPPGLVTIEADAQDFDGVIQRVDFYADAMFVGAADIPPYIVQMTNNVLGLHLLTAIATDDLGLTATSAPVSIIITRHTNLPPTVSITLPADGASFATPPGLVTIEADARDTDGVIQRVDFYADVMFVGAAATAPYIVQMTNNVLGLHLLTAIATDDAGLTATSAPVSIIIRSCNPTLDAPPLVNQTRCICDEVMFSTSVSSVDPASFVWRFNGLVLPGQTNSFLLLQNLKAGDAGTYSVDISTPCASISRSATLTLQGAGNQNPVSFTNSSRITLFDHANATPYPSPIQVACVPGLIKSISVTLDGLSHNFPDDVDVLLLSPSGVALKLMSDAGGSLKLTNVVITFSDTATNPLPDSTRIFPGSYAPADYAPADTFPSVTPVVMATNFVPFLHTDPNGQWSLFVLDDLGGDAGAIERGWRLTLEWEDTAPVLASPALLADGRFQITLNTLPHMTHVLEVSVDLATWIPISTNTVTGPTPIILSPPTDDAPCRFYRAVRCP